MYLYFTVLRITSLHFAVSNSTCLRSAMFRYFFTLHDKTIPYLTKLRHTQLNFAVLYSDVSILRQSLLRHTLPHCTVLLITSFGFSLGYALPDWTLLVIARQDSTLPYWDRTSLCLTQLLFYFSRLHDNWICLRWTLPRFAHLNLTWLDRTALHLDVSSLDFALPYYSWIDSISQNHTRPDFARLCSTALGCVFAILYWTMLNLGQLDSTWLCSTLQYWGVSLLCCTELGYT